MADRGSGDGIFAFLLGGILGAAAGLLLAPCSGEETRSKLASWLEEERRKTREFLARERPSMTQTRDALNAAWEAGKKAYRDSGRGEEA